MSCKTRPDVSRFLLTAATTLFEFGMAAANKSAKRKLYKPAASAALPSKETHGKSLAQGVLTNSNTSWKEELNRSSSEVQSLVEKGSKKDIKTLLIKEQSHFSDSFSSPVAVSEDAELPKALSNADVRTPEKQQGVGRYRNEVVVVDASGPSLDPESSEIPTTTHKIFSPAKVICHSPSPERQQHQHVPSSVEQKYNVRVDSPVTVVFEEKSTIQDESKEEVEQESVERSSKSDLKPQPKQVKKKKKAPRVVQSRYKNPKESTKPIKTNDESQRISKPAAHSFLHDISAIASHSVVEGPTKGQGAKAKKAKVTSTPFNPAAWSEKTRMIADGSYLDMSRNLTIGQHDVIHEIARKEEKISKAKTSSIVQGKSTNTDSGIMLGSQEQAEPVTEKQLEMEYCRMLQAMFLNAKAKETFAKQEKEAKDQIFTVWQENQRLKADIRQLEQAIHAKKQAMVLDQILKIQDAGLRPLDESLDRLHNNYSTMGEALDNTRHYLPVEDVLLTNEEKLISALKESQMLLTEIYSYTGTKENNIHKMALNLSQMVEKMTAESTNLEKCQELLVAANTLTSQERSLQSQILQSQDNNRW